MLGSTAMMPHMSSSSLVRQGPAVLCSNLEDWPEQHLQISLETNCDANRQVSQDKNPVIGQVDRLCLFKLNMPAISGLVATICLSNECQSADIRAGFYTMYQVNEREELRYDYPRISSGRQQSLDEIKISLAKPDGAARLVEIGVYCRFESHVEPHTLFHIYDMMIKPMEILSDTWTVGGVRTLHRELDGNVERRLAWTWYGDKKNWHDHLPWSSSTTGPFSHFSVLLGGRNLGTAYCLEFPLRRDDIDEMDEMDELDAVIQGFLYGGEVITSSSTIIKKTDLCVSEGYCSFG